MRHVEVTPYGWPGKLKELPAGLFVCNGIIGIKTECTEEGDPSSYECYDITTGEIFGAGTEQDRDGLTATPCILESDNNE